MQELHSYGMAFLIVGLVAMCGIVAFLIFGFPLLRKIGDKASGLYMPSDSSFRLMPEYSLAEARAKRGKYQEAVDEYRKVIVEHPDDIHPHLRIADLALNHLNDLKLAEFELTLAFAKARGEDTMALAAGWPISVSTRCRIQSEPWK